MAFLKASSPHGHAANSTNQFMRLVILATLPGVAVLTYFFGFGTLVNILWASVVALSCEALILSIRKRPVGFYLNDGSALVTAFLIGIALPPYAPWWLVLVGTAFAIVICKQLYGGMGYNPFNPAMAAYVVLLISFPVQMTSWAAPVALVDGTVPTLIEAFKLNFGLMPAFDGITMATPLDVMKQSKGLSIDELWAANPQFGHVGGLGWEWVNIAFLAGGLYLLYKKVFTWHAPVAMLSALALMAAIFYDGGSSNSGGSPLYHLTTGATMFAAFFIITDPVTSAVSLRGRVIYGALIGILVYIIRTWGNYPDAFAFSVLLMNFAAPFIDTVSQPRTYGHNKGAK
ncbi:Ion-translocating oxidoreductase complex subunit D [Sinobacterium norvegicum]|uniref:Ion-translocating oxidoreductase complex subunit D n=1 Tax=Sinobacterium norvegicum TaxID=1641715 RepID=A0ABN8EIK7_9GAMM|nr:electron transport complex subunit RsxD [Sinobacterium norvegicum]CAH0992298.1 Ion-translocating oxidoreductase complex subunit D [Sinobacterium norvegicum]